jgi:dTDP-4-dehydrorhamnose 3,5-epimerase-like enzyme
MEDWKNIKIDDPELWPKQSVVELEPPHADGRGFIQSLVNFPVKNISLIFSKANSLRSNHYHKTDWHYMYVLSGKMEYHFRPTDSNEEPVKIILSKGDMVFTPPMEDHTSIFLEDTELVVMSRNPRDQESYESDVVRIELVDPKTLENNVG